MPIYEYKCGKCGHKVEVFSRPGEDTLRDCVVCHGPMRKVFHPAGIIFKGSGFYTTDYARSSDKKEETKEKKSEKKKSTE
ncbi:MAG: FmdB family zinc ribbon protein, partial [Candidatus Aenigmatarchaeota archaeon]